MLVGLHLLSATQILNGRHPAPARSVQDGLDFHKTLSEGLLGNGRLYEAHSRPSEHAGGATGPVPFDDTPRGILRGVVDARRRQGQTIGQKGAAIKLR